MRRRSEGTGLFATQRLSKGLKVLSEAPLLVYEARDDLVADVEYQFPPLPEQVSGCLPACTRVTATRSPGCTSVPSERPRSPCPVAFAGLLG